MPDYIIIIGSMKCGTSSLYEYLASHPEICPALNKEPEFFSNNQKHGSSVESYDELWPGFDETIHKYKMEASTGYTKYPVDMNVPEKIYLSKIRAKFIYLVRNPYDRITSHINFLKHVGKQLNGSGDSQLLNTTRYYLQLSQYRKYFSREDILLLDFDELKESPQCVLRKVFEFLGLKEHYPETYEVVNATRPESVVEEKIRKSKLRTLLHFIPSGLKNRVKGLIRNTFPPKKRMLTDKEREEIRKHLLDDMLKFKAEYGFDTSKWGF